MFVEVGGVSNYGQTNASLKARLTVGCNRLAEFHQILT
jgi:hypothetical protein